MQGSDQPFRREEDIRCASAGSTAAGPGLSSEGMPRPSRESGMSQQPILKGHDGGKGRDEVTGESVLNEVYDLLRRRLPSVDPSDRLRPTLMRFLPLLGEALGRPRLVEVEGRPTARGAQG